MSSKSFKSLSEVKNFVEIAWSKIQIETLEKTINGMSNGYTRVIAFGGNDIGK